MYGIDVHTSDYAVVEVQLPLHPSANLANFETTLCSGRPPHLPIMLGLGHRDRPAVELSPILKYPTDLCTDFR